MKGTGMYGNGTTMKSPEEQYRPCIERYRLNNSSKPEGRGFCEGHSPEASKLSILRLLSFQTEQKDCNCPDCDISSLLIATLVKLHLNHILAGSGSKSTAYRAIPLK